MEKHMMPYRRHQRSSNSARLTVAILLIGLFLSFAFGGFNLIIFFIFLAIALFAGSLSTLNPRRMYNGLIGAMWMIILALFFVTHAWHLFVIGIFITTLMLAFARPILASLLNQVPFTLFRQQQRHYYQPSQALLPPLPPQLPYQPYDQGYRASSSTSETYQESEQLSPYFSPATQDYEQPQAQYPQQMPPM
jgi:hypothetical protein